MTAALLVCMLWACESRSNLTPRYAYDTYDMRVRQISWWCSGTKHCCGGAPTSQDPEEYPTIVYGRHLNKVAGLTMPEGGVLPGVTVEIASDVDNPFVGAKGAVAVRHHMPRTHAHARKPVFTEQHVVQVFSAQKGATAEIQLRLEEGMHRVAGFYRDSLPLGIDVSHMPGTGSAGGLTGGIVAATGAKIKRVILPHTLNRRTQRDEAARLGLTCLD
jgi:glycerate kinase